MVGLAPEGAPPHADDLVERQTHHGEAGADDRVHGAVVQTMEHIEVASGADPAMMHEKEEAGESYGPLVHTEVQSRPHEPPIQLLPGQLVPSVSRG